MGHRACFASISPASLFFCAKFLLAAVELQEAIASILNIKRLDAERVKVNGDDTLEEKNTKVIVETILKKVFELVSFKSWF